jgi:hypothetical protein
MDRGISKEVMEAAAAEEIETDGSIRRVSRVRNLPFVCPYVLCKVVKKQRPQNRLQTA